MEGKLIASSSFIVRSLYSVQCINTFFAGYFKNKNIFKMYNIAKQFFSGIPETKFV